MSSALLHPEKRRTEDRERERETNEKRRDTECSRAHQQEKKMMNRGLNSFTLHICMCMILITHILLFSICILCKREKKYKINDYLSLFVSIIRTTLTRILARVKTNCFLSYEIYRAL